MIEIKSNFYYIIENLFKKQSKDELIDTCVAFMIMSLLDHGCKTDEDKQVIYDLLNPIY